MNVHVPVTIAAMLVFLTCLTVTAVSGKVLRVEKASLETDEVRSTVEEDNAAIRRDSLAMTQQMDDLMVETKHEDDPVKVAFSVASHISFGPVSSKTNIPYEITNTNIGSGWNSGISAFLAPVDGFYEFSATMRSSDQANAHTLCHIVHTDSTRQTIMASMYGGYGNTGVESGMASSVIIELEQGDYVSVQLDGSYGGNVFSRSDQVYSTFSGFLLFS